MCTHTPAQGDKVIYILMRYMAGAAVEPCVIYDFGVRQQPQFGLHFATEFPQCEVHAFDPSPVSTAFMSGDDELAVKLQNLPNYHFHPYGAAVGS